MKTHMNYTYPNSVIPSKMRWFADEGDKGDKGDAGDKGDKGKGAADGTISKADYDTAVADLEKTKADLEDMRMEVLTPEYLDFLNTGRKGADKGKDTEDKGGEPKEEDLEKLSKKEILALAQKKAKEEIDSFKENFKNESSAATQKEVAAFSRTHSDYKTYRPIMYGLSLDPKNKDFSLDELYTAAKEHVKGIHTETTEEEKKKQEKLKNEKPGGSSESFEELKKLSSVDATKKAAEEVSTQLGDFPSA